MSFVRLQPCVCCKSLSMGEDQGCEAGAQAIFLHFSMVGAGARVARSTFCQGVKSNPEKSQILRQGARKGPTIFFQS